MPEQLTALLARVALEHADGWWDSLTVFECTCGHTEPIPATDYGSVDAEAAATWWAAHLAAAQAAALVDADLAIRQCRACGCTDDQACWPPCWWVEPDLCNSCPPDQSPAIDDRSTT